MTEWVQVLVTMADGPSLPVHGVIRKTPDKPERINFASVGDHEPMLVGVGGGDVRIWRDRAELRVESLDGQPLFITDGETAWQFGPSDEPPLRTDARRARYLGSGSDLLRNRPAGEWVGDDYTRPAAPIEDVTFLGRACWAVDLAPGPRKSGVLRIVVDRESGAVLEQRNDAAGVRVAYTEITVGAPVAPELFTWTGPSRDDRERTTRTRAGQDRAQEWFRTMVADTLPVLRVPLPLRIEAILEHDEATGAFQAALGNGVAHIMLARRPRTGTPWKLHWHGTVHRWATGAFDWAANLPTGDLDADSLAALQAALHPGEAAIVTD